MNQSSKGKWRACVSQETEIKPAFKRDEKEESFLKSWGKLSGVWVIQQPLLPAQAARQFNKTGTTLDKAEAYFLFLFFVSSLSSRISQGILISCMVLEF